MNKSLTAVLIALVLALFLTGCTAVGSSLRHSKKIAGSDPGVIANTVKVSRNNVISVGRVSGEDEIEVKRTLEVTTAPLGDRGRVRFLLPADRPATDFEELKAFLDDGSGDLVEGLTRTMADFLTFIEVDLEVDVVLVSEPGSYYSSRASLDDRLLLSLMLYDPFTLQSRFEHREAEWWFGLADIAAHELFHLHRSLAGLRLTSVDEETAASMIGFCSAFQYGLMVGMTGHGVALFDKAAGPGIRQYFPEIDQGRLDPDLEKLDELPTATTKGSALAAGVLYLLAGSNEIHPTKDRDAFERIFDYCDGLADEVPRFHMGEW